MEYILSQQQYLFLKENKTNILFSQSHPNVFILNNKLYSKKNGSEILSESVASTLGDVGDWANKGIEAISDMVDGWDTKDWAHLSVDVLAAVMGTIFPGVGDKAVEAAHLLWWGVEYYNFDKSNDDAGKTEAALNMAAIATLGLIFPVLGAAAMATLKAPFKIMGKVMAGLNKFAGKEVAKQEVKYVVKQKVGKEAVEYYMTKAELDAFAKAEPALYKSAIKEGNIIGNVFKKLGKKIGPETLQSVEVKTLSLLQKWKQSLGSSTFAKPFKFLLTVLDTLISSVKYIFNTLGLMFVILGRTPAVDIIDQEYLNNSIEDLTHASVEAIEGSDHNRHTLIVPIEFRDDVDFPEPMVMIALRMKAFKNLQELSEGKIEKEAPFKNPVYYHIVGSQSKVLPVFLVYALNNETGELYTNFMDIENKNVWMTAEELSKLVNFSVTFKIVPKDSISDSDKNQYDLVRKLIGNIDKEKITKFTDFRKALVDTGIVTDEKLTGEYYKIPDVANYKNSLKR